MTIFNESVSQPLTLGDEGVGWPRDWDGFASNFLELAEVVDFTAVFERDVVDTLVLTQAVQEYLAQFYEPVSQALALSDIAAATNTLNVGVVETLDLQHLLLEVQSVVHTLVLTQFVNDGKTLGRDTVQSLSLAQLISEILLKPEDHTLTLSDTVGTTADYNRAVVHSCVLTQQVEGWISGAGPECSVEAWPETGDPTLDQCP